VARTQPRNRNYSILQSLRFAHTLHVSTHNDNSPKSNNSLFNGNSMFSVWYSTKSVLLSSKLQGVTLLTIEMGKKRQSLEVNQCKRKGQSE
jgi:hypothetical protein